MRDSPAGGESGPHAIVFGKETIPLTVVFSERRTMKIEVRPDRQVVVGVPGGTPLEEILRRVRRRAPWIAKQRAYFERFLPMQPPRRYVGGETHLYLGRQVRLKLVADQVESVKLLGKLLVVRLARPGDAARVKILIEGWFKRHGRTVIEGRLTKCYERVQGSGIPRPHVRFQKMEKRWGSCSRRGTIVLNSELAKASVPCIDYVLYHELCHLKFPNHGKEFYRLLARFVPDWRRWKDRLESTTV